MSLLQSEIASVDSAPIPAAPVAAAVAARTTAPRFRSTAAFAARTRAQAPAIERATFVTFSLAGRRFAAAVEAVERVLRTGSAPSVRVTHVAYAGREVPLADLAAALGAEQETTPHARVLIVTVPGGWIGVTVDQVHEIATVDASGITPIDHEHSAAAVPGVRGRFVRQDEETLVLDIARALGFRHG